MVGPLQGAAIRIHKGPGWNKAQMWARPVAKASQVERQARALCVEVARDWRQDQVRPRPSAFLGDGKEAPRRGAGTLPDTDTV